MSRPNQGAAGADCQRLHNLFYVLLPLSAAPILLLVLMQCMMVHVKALLFDMQWCLSSLSQVANIQALQLANSPVHFVSCNLFAACYFRLMFVAVANWFILIPQGTPTYSDNLWYWYANGKGQGSDSRTFLWQELYKRPARDGNVGWAGVHVVGDNYVTT